MTYAASVAVDFAGDPYKTLTLTGNVAITTAIPGHFHPSLCLLRGQQVGVAGQAE